MNGLRSPRYKTKKKSLLQHALPMLVLNWLQDSSSGAVKVWDLATGTLLIQVGVLDAPISVIGCEKENMHILAGSDEGELKSLHIVPNELSAELLSDWITAAWGTAVNKSSEQVEGLSTKSWIKKQEKALRQIESWLELTLDSRERVMLAEAMLKVFTFDRESDSSNYAVHRFGR